VAIYANGQKLGYIPDNNWLDMYHDFIKRDEPVIAIVRQKSAKEKPIMRLSFCKKRVSLKEYMDRNTQGKTYKLTGKDTEYAAPEVGEICMLDWAYEKEQYNVLDSSGNPIGKMPKKFLDDNDIDGDELKHPEKLDVFVVENSMDDNSKPIIKVIVYE
jgi:hypothetical protein